MITGPLDNKQLRKTITECLQCLETLFKAYQQDSEFNYQLVNELSAFNQLKKLVGWKPIEEYFDNNHDWVLVQFEEIETGFRGLPEIAEFRTIDNKWHTNADDWATDNYLAEMCKPIAFMELNSDLMKEVLK